MVQWSTQTSETLEVVEIVTLFPEEFALPDVVDKTIEIPCFDPALLGDLERMEPPSLLCSVRPQEDLRQNETFIHQSLAWPPPSSSRGFGAGCCLRSRPSTQLVADRRHRVSLSLGSILHFSLPPKSAATLGSHTAICLLFTDLSRSISSCPATVTTTSISCGAHRVL